MIKKDEVDTIKIERDLFLRLEFQNNPVAPGNKYRKLKYNIELMLNRGIDTLLTFGGAFSNHIAAVAQAGDYYNFKTIGIIRGEEIQFKYLENPTLRLASEMGMHLKFVSREDYREKDTSIFIQSLRDEFGEFYLLPEGGTNDLAVKGCQEILREGDEYYDMICCSVGTGGTLAGLINSSKDHQEVVGFPALKGDFLSDEIAKFTRRNNWRLAADYHFGGYGKINRELISFMNRFRAQNGVSLDPVYTSKMMYGLYDMREKGLIPRNKKILAIHTGGLQGIEGMNNALLKKGLPLLEV